MIVEDNGRGFSPIAPMPSGSPSKRPGLLVSGTLEVEKALGQGCTLHIRRPL